MRRSVLSALALCAAGATVLAGCSSGGSGSVGSSAANAASSQAQASTPAASSAGATAATASGAAMAGSAGSGQALTDKSFKIALDLPEHTSPRYEAKDRPYFKAALKQFCPNCQMLYANGENSAQTQQKQAESFLANGAKVIVFDPVDGVAAASVVAAAKADNVPVVAYDRLIHSPDLAYVVSNNYSEVGKLQATTFVKALKAQGVPAGSGVLMMNGADTDNNAKNIKNAAVPIVTGAGYKILASHDTWTPDEAQQWFSSQITRFGHKIKGIYTANDTNANMAIAAMKSAGWTDAQIHAMDLTGLDATVAGIQRILSGLQLMTTYNAFKLEATHAAKAAVQLALGKTPKSNGTVDNHPAFLNPPQAVTIDTIKSTVIKDGFWTTAQICTAQFKAACTKAGLS